MPRKASLEPASCVARSTGRGGGFWSAVWISFLKWTSQYSFCMSLLSLLDSYHNYCCPQLQRADPLAASLQGTGAIATASSSSTRRPLALSAQLRCVHAVHKPQIIINIMCHTFSIGSARSADEMDLKNMGGRTTCKNCTKRPKQGQDAEAVRDRYQGRQVRETSTPEANEATAESGRGCGQGCWQGATKTGQRNGGP
jgi:hypothetical protein